MTPLPLHPSRPLRWASRLVQSLLWAVVGLWLVVGLVWGAIHVFIVPRIADWRVELEALATRAVGVPVRIGQVAVHTQGLVPSFELNQVTLLNAQGQAALTLERVMVSVSARSLLKRGVEQLHIEGPTLDVRRTADGSWWVAGLHMGGTETASTPALADWFFTQPELAIRGGTVRWQDELHPRAALALTQVDVVVRNAGNRHLMRLDATPPQRMGQRFTLQADMTSPFWSQHPGQWQQWSGTAYGHWPALDWAQVAVPAAWADHWGVAFYQGTGAMRVWLDVNEGAATGGTADIALAQVEARFAQAPADLALARLQGRLHARHTAAHTELRTTGLHLETQPGAHWQPGDLTLTLYPHTAGARGNLQASRLDLAALHSLASGLPLPPALHTRVLSLQPRGEVSALQLSWDMGATPGPRYSAQGQVQHLALAPGDTPPPEPLVAGGAPRPVPGRPGLAGAQLQFDLNQDGGRASVALENGWLAFPGVFDEPQLPIEQLSGDVRWRIRGGDVSVELKRLRFANADLQGQANAQWRTSNPAISPSGQRYPGVLTLEGSLSRAKADRVHRYMPQVVGPHARDYVRASVTGGVARNVRFRVAGDLWHMPFAEPGQGEFHVVVPLSGVDYAYIPASYSPAGEPTWPALQKASGQLVFDRASLSVRIDQAGVAHAPGLKVVQGTARIADLMQHPVVQVDARLEGPLTQALAVVRQSPLSGMTAQSLNTTTGTGDAAIGFGLTVPLDDSLKTQVKGRVTLAGNDLRLTPQSPALSRTRGTVEFSETGFWVTQATAEVAGGELQFSGGLAGREQGVRFTGRGRATVAGLSQVGLPPSLLRHAQGQTPYAVQLGLREGRTEWAVQTELKGVALNLPAPLNKTAEQAWPLYYHHRTGGGPETLTVRVVPSEQTLGQVHWERPGPATPAAPPSAPRGWVRWGPPTDALPNLPPAGWGLYLQLPELDADAWWAHLNPPAHAWAATDTSQTSVGEAFDGPLPSPVRLETALLRVWGRDLHRVRVQAQPDAQPQGLVNWRAQIQADELAGHAVYAPPHSTAAQTGAADTRDGQIQARLQWLRLNTRAPEGASAPPAPAATATTALPALDVVVDALELDGRALGQLTLEATNRATGPTSPREWQLHRLALRVPEAELTARGTWSPATSAEPTAPRQTQLNVALAIRDSGALLQRFGMPGVFRGGQGQLSGTLGWQGAPSRMHMPSLSGQLKLDIASGQFLKADPGLAKLLGVLSLQSLPRRLTLDFSDVFTRGFAFDFVRGDARIERGVLSTQNLQMKGPNAAVLMEGEADIAAETQRIRAVVVPELNAGTASLIATVINPAAGLGSLLAQAVLRQPLAAASSQSFLIHGPWADPQVDKISLSPDNPEPVAR